MEKVSVCNKCGVPLTVADAWKDSFDERGYWHFGFSLGKLEVMKNDYNTVHELLKCKFWQLEATLKCKFDELKKQLKKEKTWTQKK